MYDHRVFEDFSVPCKQQLYSVAFICGEQQILPAQLATVMRDLGLNFAQIIDSVPMLDGLAYLDVIRKLAEIRAEIATARQQVRAAEDN